MDIILNIISPEQKRELKLKKLYHEIKNLIVIVLLFTIIAAIIILIARSALQNNFYQLVEQNMSVVKGNQEFNRKIALINHNLRIISDIQAAYRPQAQTLSAFNQLVPASIKFNSFKIDSSGLIEVMGTAENRDSLLQFKQNLESAPWLTGLNLPVKNLLEKENASFSLSLKIKNWP